MLLNFLMFSVILVVITSSSSSSDADCNRVCKGGSNRETPVRYPFGFSDGCKIRLNCTEDTGTFRIGKHQVLDLTSDRIFVRLPAKCDRPFQDIHLLRSSNYALTWRNSLLLGDCNFTMNDCVISTAIMETQFNLPSCNKLANGSFNCYSDEARDPVEFMDLVGLELAGCRVLYSSITVDLDRNGSTRNSSVSMGFGSVELGWWVEGDCGCDRKAVCENVSIDGARVGYRCRCNEGYDGDGFVAGDGCRRASKCNASKYMSGDCGGTTRVGVLIGGIFAGASLASVIALICYCLRKRTILRNQMSTKRLVSEATGSFNIPFYSHKEIERATNGFSDKLRLGVGAYGTVYAGTLNNEQVAIKKIRHMESYGMDQVMNEIKLLSSVSHPNLVRLLGCCIEKGEQILVYEYMQNGTLFQHLQRERGKGLPWRIRLTIASETANAIAYLHSAVNPPIYHRDIKSSNILLDYNYSSKVADFGLSRLGMQDESHISTAPQGTPGYVDPQYHQNFHLSDKSDVYSFGVVLVEIITALKVVDLSRCNSEVNLAALAIDKIGKGRVGEIIDPFLEADGETWVVSSIHKVAELAFRCLAFHGDMRPSMMEVAEELEQIRVEGGWGGIDDSIITIGSVSVASSSPYDGSRRLVLPEAVSDRLSRKANEKDGSPVSVQDGWLSEQNSPSASSLLNNVF